MDGAATGHRTLGALFDRPIVPVADAQAWTGTTDAAANAMVARLDTRSPMRAGQRNAFASVRAIAVSGLVQAVGPREGRILIVDTGWEVG